MKDIINRILKILSTVIFIILILIIIVIIAYIVRINVLAKEDRLGDIRVNIYTILTQSMYPTIKAGDVVVTYREPEDKYNTGDIITFISDTNGGITITHRVKEIYSINDAFSYRTQGDNNNTPDNEIVPGSNVFGRVVLKIPKIGYIQQFLSSMMGWVVVIVIPCLGIIIYDILKVVLVVTGIKTGNELTKTAKESRRVMEARQNLRETFDIEEDSSDQEKDTTGDENLQEKEEVSEENNDAETSEEDERIEEEAIEEKKEEVNEEIEYNTEEVPEKKEEEVIDDEREE